MYNMKQDTEKTAIMEHRGPMSLAVIRDKLEILYERIRHYECDAEYEDQPQQTQDINREWTEAESETERLCVLASNRRYGKMTVREIGAKWDALDKKQRKEMLRFLPYLDRILDGFVNDGLAMRVYNAPGSSWNELDGEIRAAFERHADFDSRTSGTA